MTLPEFQMISDTVTREHSVRFVLAAASDRLAPALSATLLAARPRTLPDGENFGGKFHNGPPKRLRKWDL
jgi:hypothetical protein